MHSSLMEFLVIFGNTIQWYYQLEMGITVTRVERSKLERSQKINDVIFQNTKI